MFIPCQFFPFFISEVWSFDLVSLILFIKSFQSVIPVSLFLYIASCWKFCCFQSRLEVQKWQSEALTIADSNQPQKSSLWTYFTLCSSVSIVNVEHAIAGWMMVSSLSREKEYEGVNFLLKECSFYNVVFFIESYVGIPLVVAFSEYAG